jgi:hypothetical protein
VDKDWKLITGFAVFGLVVTGLIAYMTSSDILDLDLFVIFCPPILLSIPLSEVMKDKAGAYVIWSLIGVLNSGLYAVVGATVVGLRKGSRTKSD